MENRLSNLIKHYNAWFRLTRAWALLQQTIFITLAALTGYLLVDRLVYLDLDVTFTGMVMGIVALFVFLVGFITMRRQPEYVSYLVDRQANLKNLIASGLEVENRQDPVSQAVVARAEGALKEQNPRQSIPLGMNWGGKYAMLPLVAIVGIYSFMPNVDFFERKKVADAKKEMKARQERSAKLINETISQLKQVKSNVKSIDGKDIQQDMAELAKELQNAPNRKEALSKLNTLENRYKKEFGQKRDFQKATQNIEARLNAADLNQDSRKWLRKLAGSMRKNDFEKSAEAMRQLAKQMESDKLNDEEKQAMAREMQKMMSHMQGQQQADQLAKSLKQMQASPAQQKPGQSNQGKQGQNKKPQQKPGQQMTQKTNQQQKPGQKQAGQKPQQKKPAQKSPNQQAKAGNKQGNSKSGQCNKPGSKAGSKPGQNGSPQEQQANAADQMNQMADTFQQMDSLQQMQKGLEKAREEMVGNEFKGFSEKDVDQFLGEKGQGNQPGQCPGGNKPGQGQGMKGPGQGAGGVAPEKMTQTGEKEKFSKSKSRKGKVVNQLWVYGIPEKGEVREEYSAEVRNAREEAMSSLAKNRVPKEYEGMVKDYFGSLNEKKEE